ncbi:ethylene-responsive transcription factor ERF027-like [Musa acuminata AAA Group]|uniref:ethylene-responsive transcription factor ERF027-like n=1 Tax=Musa acuminata AAA Group TaxID=214697 RepID=UPI0031E02712
MGAKRAAYGKHPTYHGVRCRYGKWVTEIREPRKESRIWLGAYPTGGRGLRRRRLCWEKDTTKKRIKNTMETNNKHKIKNTLGKIFRLETCINTFLKTIFAPSSQNSATSQDFPGEVASRPAPTTASPAAIHAAAKDAAASLLGKARVETSEAVALHGLGNDASEFVDDESMFNMPQLLVNMAEGMLLSPPAWSAHHSPEVLEWESLWSYQ